MFTAPFFIFCITSQLMMPTNETHHCAVTSLNSTGDLLQFLYSTLPLGGSLVYAGTGLLLFYFNTYACCKKPSGWLSEIWQRDISQETSSCIFYEKRAARKRTHSAQSISSHIRQEITQAERQITDPPKGEEDSVLLFIGAVGSSSARN